MKRTEKKISIGVKENIKFHLTDYYLKNFFKNLVKVTSGWSPKFSGSVIGLAKLNPS